MLAGLIVVAAIAVVFPARRRFSRPFDSSARR
jgi:hypothetical protein